MPGFLDIDGEIQAWSIHPGPRLPDGQDIAIAGRQLLVGSQSHDLEFLRDGARLWVRLAGQTHVVQFCDAVAYLAGAAEDGPAGGLARAPMPGLVVSTCVAVGDAVRAGDPLLVIESMKLETTIAAGIAGTVKAIHFATGESFDRDATLAEIEVFH